MSGYYYPSFPKAIKSSFANLATIAQRQYLEYGDPDLADLVGDAAILMLEKQIPLEDAWNQVRDNYYSRMRRQPKISSIEIYADIGCDNGNDSPRFPTPRQLSYEDTNNYYLQDPGWLELLVAKIKPLQQFAPNGTQRAHARRAIKILEILCDRIDQEEYSLEEGRRSFVNEPRLSIYEYVSTCLREQGDPIGIDTLKHTFQWIREQAEPILERCRIEIIPTRGKK